LLPGFWFIVFLFFFFSSSCTLSSSYSLLLVSAAIRGPPNLEIDIFFSTSAPFFV